MPTPVGDPRGRGTLPDPLQDRGEMMYFIGLIAAFAASINLVNWLGNSVNFYAGAALMLALVSIGSFVTAATDSISTAIVESQKKVSHHE